MLYMRGFWVRVKVVLSLCDTCDGLVGGSFSSSCDIGGDFEVDWESRGRLRRERNFRWLAFNTRTLVARGLLYSLPSWQQRPGASYHRRHCRESAYAPHPTPFVSFLCL